MLDLSRRALLTLLASAASLAVQHDGVRAADIARRPLVLLRLNGGMDGLGALVPFADPDYRAARAGLDFRMPGEPGGVLDLDGRFGLHPALPTFANLYRRRELIAIAAAGSGYAGRAHGEGQAHLDRCLSPLRTLSDARPDGAHEADLAADLAACHPALAGRMLGLAEVRGCQRAVAGHLGSVLAERRVDLVAGAAAIGRAIAAGATQPMSLDSFGWDSHAEQGAASGRLAFSLASLDKAIAALRAAAGPAWRHVAVLVVTEFGRSITINASGGTDHGGASAAFILGGAVAGGRLLGPWPGLQRAADLEATVDLGAVARTLAAEHLGAQDAPAAASLAGLVHA